MNTETTIPPVTEKSFTEIMDETSRALANIIAIGNYWKERCQAAERYIESKDQYDHLKWLNAKELIPTFKEINKP